MNTAASIQPNFITSTMEDYPLSSLTLNENGLLIATDQIGLDWLGLTKSQLPIALADLMNADDRLRWREIWSARTLNDELEFHFCSTNSTNEIHLFQLKGYSICIGSQCIWNFTFKQLPYALKEDDASSNNFYALPFSDIFRNFYLNLSQIQNLYFIVFDADFNIVAYNTEVKNVYQISGSILGKNLLDFFPNFKQVIRYKEIEKALNGELIPFRKYHSELINRHIEDFILPIKNHTGKIIGLTIIGRDITDDMEQLQVAQSKNAHLENLNRDLQTSNNDLYQFASIASHDLQEPLRKINMFSSRIAERDFAHLSDESKRYFERINNSIFRMNRLIQSLLNFSKVGTALEKKSLKLQEIIDEVKLDLEAVIVEKKAQITTHNLPQLKADRFQMIQLFQNLIGNAIKYAKHHQAPVVTIYSEVIQMDSRNYYRITVEDNGIGFSEEYADRLFDMFMRLHGKQEYEGTGIGLALCKRIVENHGGRINAESVLGQGSKFHVYLPC